MWREEPEDIFHTHPSFKSKLHKFSFCNKITHEIEICFFNIIMICSSIHKAAGSLVTSYSKKMPLAGMTPPPPETIPLFTASGMEQWNDGIVPVKSLNGREL